MMNIDTTASGVDDSSSHVEEKKAIVENGTDNVNISTPGSNSTQQEEQQQMLLSSLPDNRFELELEFIQALASPAYIHFLATSRAIDDSLSSSFLPSSTAQQSTFQHLQPFLHYLYNTYSQPEYARFLRYPHALYFLESLLVYDDEDDDDTTTDHNNPPRKDAANSGAVNSSTGNNTNKLWVEWTVPSFRNFCHQQQFLAWQHRHATCYGVGSNASPATLLSDTNQHQQEQLLSMEHSDDESDDDDDDSNTNKAQ